jgi:hypothetical protein
VIKVLSCVALILALSRFRLHLSLCLVVGATALGAWMGMPPGRIVASVAGPDLSRRERACFEASLLASYRHLYKPLPVVTGIRMAVLVLLAPL